MFTKILTDSGEIDRDEMRECIEICTKESNLGMDLLLNRHFHLYILTKNRILEICCATRELRYRKAVYSITP